MCCYTWVMRLMDEHALQPRCLRCNRRLASTYSACSCGAPQIPSLYDMAQYMTQGQGSAPEGGWTGLVVEALGLQSYDQAVASEWLGSNVPALPSHRGAFPPPRRDVIADIFQPQRPSSSFLPPSSRYQNQAAGFPHTTPIGGAQSFGSQMLGQVGPSTMRTINESFGTMSLHGSQTPTYNPGGLSRPAPTSQLPYDYNQQSMVDASGKSSGSLNPQVNAFGSNVSPSVAPPSAAPAT